MQPAIRCILVFILPIISILLILIGFSSTSAQLPPEIRADAYLLQVEQAIRDGDHERARTVIRSIRALQDQHDLDLADEFHFKYAKASATVGLSDLALESVVKYLASTGRDGLHYVKALEVMNQARAGSSTSDVPAQLSPGKRADAYLAHAEQAIRDGDRARAKTAILDVQSLRKQHNPDLADTFHFRYAKAAATVDLIEEALESVVTYLTVAGREGQHYAEALKLMNSVQMAVSCRGWDTEEYFKTATLEEVKTCIDTGIDVKTKDNSDVTPLHRAVKYTERPKVIQALLDAGADTDARDNDERTPLHWATEHNNPAAVNALIATGADVETQARDKLRPLHLAAGYNDSPDIVEALIGAGADPNTKAVGDWTPLHVASKTNNPVAIRALIEAGAGIEVRDVNGKTPLHFAVEYGHPEAIEVLVMAGAKKDYVKEKWTTLHWAVTYAKEPRAIGELIRSRANVKAKDKDSWRPLHVAARYNKNPDVVKALISVGADLEARARGKLRPLHVAAAYNENPNVVEALIEAGADLEARARDKLRPIHMAAAYNGNPDVVKALVKASANPNTKAKDNLTLLHLAATYNENPAVLKFVLDTGIDPNQKAKDDWTPLHMASEQNKNPAVVDLLIDAGADVKANGKDKLTALHLAAAFNSNADVVRVLIKAGAFLEARDKKKQTPLHRAATTNWNPEIVRVLIEAGANSEARAKSIIGSQWTPLHFAALWANNPKVIKELINAGSDLEAQDDDKQTPLHLAAFLNENPEVAKALINAGANTNAYDDEGRKPLYYATKYNDNPEVAKVMIDAGSDAAGAKDRLKSKGGTDWTKVAVGVLGGATIIQAGKDAPAEVTEQALADWIDVMTEGGSAAGTRTPSGASQAQGATAQGGMEQALRNLESVCGETYRSGFGPNDHARFYCMAVFNDHCAIKRAQTEEAKTKLRASKARNCGVMQGQGLAGKCSYCQ